MKSQYRPIFAFIVLLVFVSLACSALSGGNDPAPIPTTPPQPTAETIVQPPSQQEQTQQQPPQQEPPAIVNQQFFTEEFDQDTSSNWAVDILGPGADDHADSVKTAFENSRFRVELPEKQLYFYYTYLGETYENVRVDLRADNRGVNSNNVSLFCRSSDDGWYEWSVENSGLWYLYAVTADGFNLLTNGGTNDLKQGKDVNEYTLICKDKKISMFINGKELKLSPFTDNKYNLRNGQVGFNISSVNVIPVIVEVDWFKISEP